MPLHLGDFTPFASLWAKYMAPGGGAFGHIGHYLFTISPPWPGGIGWGFRLTDTLYSLYPCRQAQGSYLTQNSVNSSVLVYQSEI